MTSATPPGWYDDPEDANGQRYWDGQAWTPNRQQKPVSQPAAAPSLPPPQQAGWQAPGYPPAGPSPRGSRNPAVLIGVILAVVVLGIGGFFAVKHFVKHPASAEDQIRAVDQRETDEYNAYNVSFDPELECKANAAYEQAHAKQARKIRDESGTVSSSVANIHVTGDSATADVTVKFQKAPDQPVTIPSQFVKEDGKWKDCTPPDTSGDDAQGNGDSGN
jgi:hypothetical protein